MLSVVLPCYNEGWALEPLLAAYTCACPSGLDVELMVVNNGSTDGTAAELERLQAADPGLGRLMQVVTVPVNHGYGHGLWTGLQAARGEYLAWSHADLQCDPGDVFAAFDHLRRQPEPERTVIKGARQRRPLQESLTTMGMQISAWLILWTPLRDINAQPKVFHCSLLKELERPPEDFSFDLYVLYRAIQSGWTLATVPVMFRSRLHGESHWAFSSASRWRHAIATIRYMIRLRLGLTT